RRAPGGRVRARGQAARGAAPLPGRARACEGSRAGRALEGQGPFARGRGAQRRHRAVSGARAARGLSPGRGITPARVGSPRVECFGWRDYGPAAMGRAQLRAGATPRPGSAGVPPPSLAPARRAPGPPARLRYGSAAARRLRGAGAAGVAGGHGGGAARGSRRAPVEVGDVVDVLLGLPPARAAAGPPALAAHEDEYRLTLPLAAGAQTIWFAGDTLSVRRAEETRDGAVALRVAFGDYRDGFPHLVEVGAASGGAARAVDGVSFALDAGRVLGLVGESGCGKSVTALSLMRLVPPPGRIVGGEVFFDGRDLLTLPERDMRAVRGAGLAMIFQEPMT